ncbi:hypothetical protein EXS73_03685 [Candidatus Pacearchaeota archaeon]|nr:hypothetical protein [Candidatus Pacearchaeota archaeon]
MHKRAQFFIIAALVVSSIILGTSGIRNQAREEVVETATVDLSQELAYEAHQVIDNGVFAGTNQNDLQSQMEQLVTAYGISNPDSDIQILFGDPEHLQQIEYDTSTGSRATEIDETAGITLTERDTTASITQETDNQEGRDRKKLRVKIKLPQERRDQERGTSEDRVIERELSLSEGQNVYVIVKKKIRNDQTIVIQP